MNKIAILTLKEMPNSCNECNIFRTCKLYNAKYNKQRHPNCPLISIDIELLEEAVNTIANVVVYEEFQNGHQETMLSDNPDEFNTIKSTIFKLKGVE